MTARRAVTFDLWHTLVYLDPPAEGRYLRGLFDAATRVLEASEVVPGTPLRKTAELRAAYDREMRRAVTLSHEGRTVTPAEQFVRAANSSGRVPRPEAYLEELEKLVASTPFLPAPGAVELLGQLRGEGYGVGIVSNTVGEPGRFLRGALGRIGVGDVVEVCVFSDEGPWTKPAPEIFLEALRRLGSQPNAAVHVGDGWADLEGARRAGLLGAVLFTGLQQYAPEYRDLNFAPDWDRLTPDYKAGELREILPVVRRLLPAPGVQGVGHPP